MTIETKTTIELSDIVTVEFECKNCHAIRAWPIDAFQQPPSDCGCDSGQWMVIGADTYTRISNGIFLIRALAGMTKEPFSIRFGIRNGSLGRVSGGKD
jgi:hypothetical protein